MFRTEWTGTVRLAVSGEVRRCKARNGAVLRGEARLAWMGEAWRGKAGRGKAWLVRRFKERKGNARRRDAGKANNLDAPRGAA